MSRFHFQFENPSYVREKNFVSIKNTLDSSKHIYFIGIGGIGLSALARLYKESGKLVSGSDINKSTITDSLETLDIHIFSPQSISNIDQAIKYNGQIDCVIYSPAVLESNCELSYFLNQGIPVFSYGNGLSYFINTSNSITICGTHGKSSTTAILSEILIESSRQIKNCDLKNKNKDHGSSYLKLEKINVSFLCGAILNKYKVNSHIAGGETNIFFAEACEYKETFLNYFPKASIIPSLEIDHLDYYKKEANYLKAFIAFIEQIKDGFLIMRLETKEEITLYLFALLSKNIKKLVTYSSDKFNILLKKIRFEIEENFILKSLITDLKDIEISSKIICHFHYDYNVNRPFELKINKEFIYNLKNKFFLSKNAGNLYDLARSLEKFFIENIDNPDLSLFVLKNKLNEEYFISSKADINAFDRENIEIVDKDFFEISFPTKEYAANFTAVYLFFLFSGYLNKTTKSMFKEYHGIKRRFELVGFDNNDNIIISDYAHHPSEIRTLINIAKTKYPQRDIVLIFQAHQHSRTRLFLKDFLSLFKDIENLILLPIYEQRDTATDKKLMPSELFYKKVKKVNEFALFFDDVDLLFEYIKNKNSNVFLFTGAGSIDSFAKSYFAKYGSTQKK